MNTPAHLLIGAAVFGKRGVPKVTWAALAGAMVPDLSLYLLVGVSLLILNIPPSTVFNELYFSQAWQTIFAIDNSFLLWGGFFGVAIWRRNPCGIAFCGAGLLHLILDFPLHHDDGRAHFWPVTNWVFESPFSYWDIGHGASWVAPLEGGIATLCGGILLWRKPDWLLTAFVAILCVAEWFVIRNWLFFFLQE